MAQCKRRKDREWDVGEVVDRCGCARWCDPASCDLAAQDREPLTVTVPGALWGWNALLKRFGTMSASRAGRILTLKSRSWRKAGVTTASSNVIVVSRT